MDQPRNSAEQDRGSLAHLAYALALRGLTQQETAVAELRSRTGTLLTAASLLATFLGAIAIDREGLGALSILALTAFATSGVLSVWILLPKQGFVFRLSGPELYEANTDYRSRRSAAASPTGSRGMPSRTNRLSGGCIWRSGSQRLRSSQKPSSGVCTWRVYREHDEHDDVNHC